MAARLRDLAPDCAADIIEAAEHYALEATHVFVSMLQGVMPAQHEAFDPGPVVEMWRARYCHESLVAYLTGAIESLKKTRGEFAPETWHD